MDTLWSNFFTKRGGEKSNFDILRELPIFHGLKEGELHLIERLCHERHYAKDEKIFYQGEPGVGMYIILEGEVSIVLERENGSETLAELYPGEFFGELALLDDSPRSATAVAKKPSRILGLFQPDVFGIMERKPHVGVKLITQLARVIGERLKKANEQIQHGNHLTVVAGK